MAKKETVSKATPEEKLLARARDFFTRAEAAETDQREQELEDLKFVGLLEQWPEAIRNIREKDPEGARPCLTVDKVNQYKNQIVNNMRMNTPTIKVRPIDDTGDEEVAEIYDGLLRHIQNQSHADDAYDWAAEGAVDTGIGYFRVVTEYVDDAFVQEIGVKKIPNRFSVYADPDSTEADGSDQMECLVSEFIRRDVFERTYPGKNMMDWAESTGDSERWCTEHEVRVAEYFYIEEQDDTLYLLEDGNVVFKSDAEDEEVAFIKERPCKKRVVKWAKVSGADVLEEGTFAGQYIPIIPVKGIVTVVDGKTYWRGIVRGAKDPQRMYNYNRSTIAESLGLTIKAPYIGAVGSFDTMGDRWARANVANYAYLEYDVVTTEDGVLAPPPQRQSYSGVPAGLMADIQVSEHDIQAGMGMYDSNIAKDGNAKSGRALEQQTRQGDVATFHFPDNLSKSIRHAGRIIVSIIPKYYDTQRIVRILGEDDAQDFVSINPEQPEAMTETRDDTGAIQKVYNLGVGKYDVTVTTGPNFATKRQEGAEFLTQVAQSSPDLMPIIGDLLFKSMDMPYAEEVAERMKKMLPPELQDQEDGANPEVEQIKQQASQMIQQVTEQLDAAKQAMAEAEQEAQELVRQKEQAEMQAKNNDAKAQNDAVKNELEAKKLEIEAKKLEIEEIKVNTERLSMQKESMEAMMENPLMPEFMVENMTMMQNLVTNVLQSLDENQTLLEELTNKPKTVEMQAPNGGVYRGAVENGQMKVVTPSGEEYNGVVE